MVSNFDPSLVDWSRLQFAVTAIYHWFFVPLTLGLAFILAFMETAYVRTGKIEWKKTTQFWMKLFGINFAIGVATGIILEFEFGTNWSNYSWFVGDIFGAPLAIEGIMAFFMESTFIAIMFFGWEKLSKRVHLMATWLTAFGASLSAVWILVANGWMQNPVGMSFNPETVRNEMVNFWEVLFNPAAISKFLHTVSSSYLLASVFVVGVSCWFLWKKRETDFALRSIRLTAVFGIFMAFATAITGDYSSKVVTRCQPMKLAAMEALYVGQEGAGLSVVGLLNPDLQVGMSQEKVHRFNLEIPKGLSFLGKNDPNAFIPGINDLVHGNSERGLLSAEEKILRGKEAIATLQTYQDARKTQHPLAVQRLERLFDRNTPEGETFYQDYFRYFGYGYFDQPSDLVPHVPTIFYSFRLMVGLGCWFIVLFTLALLLQHKRKLAKARWFQGLAVLSIPLAYLSSQAGWIVAEVGRQPWVIQDLMPTHIGVSKLETSSVQVTLILFVVLFTILAIAEVWILSKQIKRGPKMEEK